MVYDQPKKTIRIKNACEVYDVSRSTIYRRIECGEITPIKSGNCLFLSVQQLDRLFMGNPEAA
jgi:excisionase family DNA binding protein